MAAYRGRPLMLVYIGSVFLGANVLSPYFISQILALAAVIITLYLWGERR